MYEQNKSWRSTPYSVQFYELVKHKSILHTSSSTNSSRVRVRYENNNNNKLSFSFAWKIREAYSPWPSQSQSPSPSLTPVAQWTSFRTNFLMKFKDAHKYRYWKARICGFRRINPIPAHESCPRWDFSYFVILIASYAQYTSTCSHTSSYSYIRLVCVDANDVHKIP